MATKISKTHKSVKHDIIDKDNTRTVAAVGLATFILVFSLFAMRALISQSLYHNRVIGEKNKALSQLEENKSALNTLQQSYNDFVGAPSNILGGASTGDGTLDGDNAQVVLDSLPSIYDYPALSSSFEKILKDGGYTINGIGGTEQPLTSTAAAPAGQALPVEVPYSLSFTATPERTQDFLETLEKSIRPMYIDTIQFQVGEDTLLARITLHTFYAQEKAFSLGSKEVK